MTENEVMEIVVEEVKNVLEITAGIDIEEDLQSRGMDSSLAILLSVRLEERFNFEFADEDFEDDTILTNVASICRYLGTKITITPD